MSQTLYKLFYKQLGVRRLQTLLSPTLIRLDSFPRDTVLHSIANGNEEIDLSKPFYRGYTKRILVDFKEILTGQRGAPKRKPTVLKTHIREWLMEHRQFKWMPEHYKTVSDPFTLLINHYGYLDSLYRYVELPMTKYNRWWNVQDTLWSSVNAIADASNRNQFIFINIPNELPSYSLLKLFSTRTTVALLKIFDTADKLSLLEFWKWLNPETRELSLLNQIDSKNFNKVNIVFINDDQQSMVINLGYLNSWITDQPNTTEFSTVMQVKADQLQRVMLKSWMACQSVTIDVIDATIEVAATRDDADVEEERMMEEEREEFQEDHDLNEDDTVNDVDFTSNLHKNAIMPISQFKESDDAAKSIEDAIKDIDEDLAILDNLNKKKLANKGLVVTDKGDIGQIEEHRPKIDIAKQVNPRSIEEIVIESVNEQVDIGSITASDYKSLIKDIQNYKQLKDPYGSKKTLGEVSVITEEDLTLDKEKVTLVDRSTVLDKGMLESSLQSFDSDYIKHILKKDIINMVGGIQKAGVVIKRHEVEIDHSALGTYENHTLEIKPIRGMTSIIRFRLPKIDEDGTFIASNNKYTLRKQRVDNPIRKINPTTVALTSYYGKSFISRGDRKATSSLEWLLKQINLSIFDDSGYISKVTPANVFDNNIKAPYIYNALSNYYKSLQTQDSFLMFDYAFRTELVSDPVLLSALEKDGKVVVGLTAAKHPIVVDTENLFWVYENGQYQPLGDIYAILQLNAKAAPLDFSEVKIFSKAIPVGILLGYYLGFTGVLELLKVSYTVVDSKPRVLEVQQYAITFADKTYIFSKEDKIASLILGGYVHFAKQIRRIEASEFEHKDVYFNLFREKGLTTIYIREADLLNQLFIDPITESILKDMGEPTVYIPLLIRATALLINYHHPDPQDMSQMRIRGYERLSGMVYKELATSLRQFNNRNIVGRSKVEMSPYKVWQAIMTDNTKKMVEDINPIQNLKEMEIVTYVGEGGRNKDAMNKASRAFHKNDMGVISESTVDSSDVGVNTYLSPNPNFKNLRGLIKADKTINTTSLLSTSTNLAVAATHDDCVL